MKLLLAIAAGGAIGAVLRHFLSTQIQNLVGSGFPWGILGVNILGSFVMGLLVETFALIADPGQTVRALLTTGLLGALTTFSTFSLEAVLLIERGQLLAAGVYTGLSVVLCISALFAGLALVRSLAG